MVFKNNQQWKRRQEAQCVPHYGLRKLSVGVASVLLSTTLYMGVTAHADTIAGTSQQPTAVQPTSTAAGTSISNVTPDTQPMADQLASNGANISTGNATTDVQSATDQPVSKATNGIVSENDVSATVEPIFLPKPSSSERYVQPTAATNGIQPITNSVVESDNNDLASDHPTVQSLAIDPAALMTNFAVTEQPADNTHNPVTTTLTARPKWVVHYTDETGKKLLPDSIITHDYTRTDTGDQMGSWSYVPDSVKVTGTPNDGWNINTPTFKFDQIDGKTAFDCATWQAAAASIDGYIPNNNSAVVTDQLPKNPEGLHATTIVDSGTHEFTFVYTQRPKTVTINYVDDEQGEKVVGTGMVSGKTGAEVTITPTLPKNYMLTPDKAVPSTYTVTDAANQVVTIHVQKQFVDLSNTDPQAKQTRTITLHYIYGAGDKQGQPAFDDAVLDVYYHRTATFDRATNQTTYGDWIWDQSQGDPSTPGYHVVSGKWTNLPQVWASVTADVPSIRGYYADLGQNDPTNINHVPSNTWVFPTYNNSLGGGTSESDKGATAYLDGYGYEVSPTHTVKYMPNKTTVTVNYVDDDNNKAVVGSQHWDGTTGQHIDLTLTPPDNYVLTPGWVNPTSYDFDGTNSSWYTVHVKHKTQDVTDQQPKDQVTKVTRLTRNHLYGDGPHKGEKFAESDIFDLAWKRTATKDLVTNKVTFGDWQVDRDNSKNVQGLLHMYSGNGSVNGSVGGSLYGGHDGYSYLGQNSHQEFISTDGSAITSGNIAFGWSPDQASKYSIVNYYYGPDQVKIPVVYVDADTGQEVASKTGDNALTGNDFRDGNTVAIVQSKLTSLPTTLTGYQLLPGQTLPTSYKIDTFAGVKSIKVQVVKDRSVKVTFVDDDAGGDIVGTPTTITGHTGGDPVALNLTVPDKYRLADGQQLPTTYTFTKGSGDVTIHLKHQVVQREATINVQRSLATGVCIGSGDVEFTITQTQLKQLDDETKHDMDKDFEVMPLVEVGTLTGHVGYDLVDKEVVSFGDDWTSLNLGDHNYKFPNGNDVVNGILIESLDYSQGKELKESYLNYYPNTDPDYVNRPWHGYLSANAINNTFAIDEIHQYGLQAGLVGNEPNALAKATGDRAATAVETTNKTIDLNWLRNFDSDLDSNPDAFVEQNGQLRTKVFLPVYGFYIPYVEKTATRTINVTTPDGKTTTVKQTATLAKQVDFSNGSHPAWTTSEWASYEVPTIPGYTASQSNVAKETVTGTTEDQTVDITYTANDQQMTITFYDQDGKKVTDKVIKGTTGSTIPVGDLIPDGWELYDGQNVPTDITFKAHNDNQDFVIKHVLSLVSADNIPVAGSVIKGTKAKTYPEGLTRDMLTKTITRIIRVMKDGHQVGIKTQRVTFLRNAVVDAVTGSVKTLAWSEDGSHVFTAYQPASIEGYTVGGVKAMMVSPLNEPSTTVIVNYKAVPQALNVIYQTADGQQVGSTASMVADKDGQIDLTSQLPNGYELATPVQKTNVSDLHVNNYYVTVKPQLKIYTSEDADIPSGVYLTKVVNRTINITLPNGKHKTINQTVNFNRMVTIDANGNSTYTDWKAVGTDTFDGVRLPVRHGYKLVFDDGSNGIKSQQVTNAETASDVVINVSYVKA